MPRRLALLSSLLLAGLGLAPAPAAAHPFVPILVEINELEPTRLEVSLKVDSHVTGGGAGKPWAERFGAAIPGVCRPTIETRIMQDARSATIREQFECDPARYGDARLSLRGDWVAGHELFFRFNGLKTGAKATMRKAPGPAFDLPLSEVTALVSAAPTDPQALFREYVGVGVEHILTGVDHLLFVLLLLWIVRSPRALLATVTAFTIAHSLTLALASFELVRLPAAVVDALVALSIVYLAAEAVDPHHRGPMSRRPWSVAFGFGLLHGLGFADAVSSFGLPLDQLPLALLGFNVGVEIGQLSFVGVIVLGGRVLGAIVRGRLGHDRAETVLRRAPVAVAGGLASYWFVHRAAAIFGLTGEG